LLRLRAGLSENDINAVIEAYDDVRKVVKLGSDDVAAIAQTLRSALRSHPGKKGGNPPPEYVAFADKLVADVRQGILPPSPKAHLHLLRFYRDAHHYDRGVKFWAWLEQQDETFVSQAIYGAAIEMLAVQGRPAEETEELYRQGLKRFPGTFNEYYMLPDAIVPDLGQPMNISGFSMSLLRGIVAARLLRGDSRQAYMGLDTALRLSPTEVPPRFFALFMEERPLSEAYKVFHIACRSGVVVGQDSVKLLLARMRYLATADPLTRLSAVRASLTGLCAYCGAGGSLTSSHATETLIALGAFMDNRDVFSQSAETLHTITDRMLSLYQQLLAVFVEASIRPTVAGYNAMLTSLVAKGKREDLVAPLLEDMRLAGLQPSIVTYRTILAASGATGNEDMLMATWRHIAHLRESAGAPLEYSDWHIFATAAVRCGQKQYVVSELEALAHMVTPTISAHVAMLLQREDRVDDKGHTDEDLKDRILSSLHYLEKDVSVLAKLLQGGSIHNFRALPFPLSLDGLPEDNLHFDGETRLRSFYDRLSTDSQRQAEEQVQAPRSFQLPALSPTGYGLDELRYQNWRAINELLAASQQCDSAYEIIVEEAISKGVAPMPRHTFWQQMHIANFADQATGLGDFYRADDGGLSSQEKKSATHAEPAWQADARSPRAILRLRRISDT